MTHDVGPTRPRTLLAASVLVLLFLLAPLLAPPAAADRDRDDRRDVTTQVVGGTAVPDGKYAFVAALLDVRNGRTAYERQFCGGSLIDADHVLTAAHCVEGANAINLRVIVGRTDLDSSQGELRGVAEIEISPLYRARGNDAAVLTLSSRIENVPPIRLAGDADNPLEASGTPLTVAGWGNQIRQPRRSSAGTNFPARMQEASVPIVGDTRCDRLYDRRVSVRVELCAGKPGKDSCQGDSGGPLFARIGGTEVVQVGIVSWGYGCGANYPGVYAEVNSPAIADFIADATAS